MKEGEGRGRKETAFPSFLPHPLTLVPCALLEICKETLAMQARTLMKLYTALVVLIL